MSGRRVGCFAVAPAALLAAFVGTAGTAGAHERTCSETLGIEVHGQHIISDYVMGATATWPPSGGVVGEAVGGRGAAVPGGPGPGFHFVHGFAPGASFCNGSESPGVHL